MAPVVPRPLVTPETSTALTSAKMSTLTSWPTWQPSMAVRNSRTNRLGSRAGLGDGLHAGGGTLLLPLALETGDVAAFDCGWQTTGLVQETQLHRFVAVAVGRLHLEDMARSRLDHRNRDYVSGESKTCVIPTLRPSSPSAIVLALCYVARGSPA